LLKKIDSLQRKRNKLEKEYQDILNDENATLDQISSKKAEIITTLSAEIIAQEGLKTSRLSEIAQYQKDNSKLNKYAWYDEELGQV
jgi:hypothetical protein